MNLPSDPDRPSGISRRALLRRAGLLAGAAAAVGSGPARALGAVAGGGAGSASTGAAAGGFLLQLARVWPSAGTMALIGTLDETHTVFADGSIEVLLWPGDRARLDAVGARYQVTVDDLVARDLADEVAARSQARASAAQPGERTAYRTLADMEADLRSLAQRFPTTARLFELPNKTHEGRTVLGIEIGRSVAVKDGRPVFYMDGVHHAREWPSAEFPIMFAYDLLENDGKDARITRIVDDVRVIIVPVVNPDGFDHSRSAIIDVQALGNPVTGNAYWRKNRRNDGGPVEPAKPGYHAYGIDPNRNYAYGWGGDGSSATTSSDTYRGTTPFSEPETRNVDHLLSTNHVHAMITNHTSGNYVLWAWSWTKDDLAEQTVVESLGRAMGSLNGYKPQKSIDLYIHTGVCVDHAYGTYSTISYTFEHGASFHPAYLPNIPDGYAKNRPAYLLLVEEACLLPSRRLPDRVLPPALTAGGYDADRLQHGLLSGRLVNGAGQAVSGTLRLQKQFPVKLWKDGSGANPIGQTTVPGVVDTTIPTASDGSFTWHVNPSSRHDDLKAGQPATYLLTASGPAGTAQRTVAVERGQTIDLGAIVLA